MKKKKLIEKNRQLLKDIYTLIDEKDKMEIISIKFRYNLHRDFIKLMLLGRTKI